MSTAIVVSQRSAYMRALMSNVARVTGITEELSPDEKRARIEEAKSQGKRPVLTLSTKEKADRSLERFLREADNPDMPYVVLVTLRPIRSRDGDEVVFNETHVSIPDPKCPSEKVSVPARVHLMVNGKGGVLPYFGVQPIVSDDETTATTFKYVAKAHWCFLLKPRGRDRHYRLAPLALGTSALFRWNLIAKTKQGNAQADQLELVQKDWPVIEPFDHCLELPENFRGRDLRNLNLYLEYQPTCYQPSNESHADSKRMYGTIFGQKVIDLSDGSVQRVPAADKLDAEGNPCFGEHVFRIFEITESSLVVLWDGAVGISTIRPQESMKFDKLHMNGFEALNLNELDADPLTVMTRAMRLATGSLDKFATAILPTLEEALAGVDIVEVWYRSSGDDDVVANWIGERIEGEFRFDSWLHTRVRTEVLRMIASKDGVSPPARPKKEKAEEPKTQVVVPPANAAPPAEEAAPAAAVKPKRARKPGKSKKDASASSPA